ncbi:MAG: serine protease, partial [Minisyncoccia bacterium]
GIMVDPRGIIMTVAHVGQNFLLTDYPTENDGECFIRTGSPAKNTYTAELIYISHDWIEENEATFLTKRPTGTGENDFAFLALTGSLTGGKIATPLPFLSLALPGTPLNEEDNVGTASYAAEFLSSSEVRSSLYPTIKFAEVEDIYTFGRNTVDIFSVAAGSAAQEGSSGGAVVNSDDRLVGLITTRTAKTDLSLRTLQALTMDHLRRSFRADMGENLDAYLKDTIPSLLARFEDDRAELLEILREDIEDARE